MYKIPYVTINGVKVYLKRNTLSEPSCCPFCGGPTTNEIRGKEGAATYCAKRSNCPAARVLKIDHWIGSSKKGVGILDIGDGLLKAMLDADLISDPADLYTLTVDQIKNLKIGAGKLGKSRADRVINNINNKRHLTLPVFLGGLGIELLGKRRVETLRSSANGNLDTLEQWRDLDNLKSVIADGLGDPSEQSILREAIISGMSDCSQLIDKLLTNGVTIINEGESPDQPTPSKSGILSGISICFTGTRELLKEAEEAGAEIKSGVSAKLDILVQLDPLSASKKSQKADELGVSVISVEVLRRVLNGSLDIQDVINAKQNEVT